MSDTRIYLISPLVTGLASAILRHPSFVKVTDLTSFILRYCQRFPEPSIDFKLEDASCNLLQSCLAPEFGKLDYAHYFGDRPSLGVAAFLDLISRLGTMFPKVLEHVFQQILAPWAAQKG